MCILWWPLDTLLASIQIRRKALVRGQQCRAAFHDESAKRLDLDEYFWRDAVHGLPRIGCDTWGVATDLYGLVSADDFLARPRARLPLDHAGNTRGATGAAKDADGTATRLHPAHFGVVDDQ